MNEKKKLFISMAIAVVLLLIGIIGYAGFKGDNTQEPNEVTDDEGKDEQFESMDEFAEDDNSPYEKLEGLNYQVLRTKFIGKDDDNPAFVMDILVNKPFTEKKLSDLGKAVQSKSNKRANPDDQLSSINLNVFTTEEAFKKTMVAKYNGEYVDGLVQNLIIMDDEPSKMISTNYAPFTPSSDIENMADELNFEVKDASIDKIEETLQADVVLSSGTKQETHDMIATLASMLKTLNKGVSYVDLTIYATEESYNKRLSVYDYSEKNPEVILEQHTTIY